jgi:hypothetical protein
MKKKEPLLQPNKWNALTGKQLVEMGERKDSDGRPIANTLKYQVWIKFPKWEIRQLKATNP